MRKIIKNRVENIIKKVQKRPSKQNYLFETSSENGLNKERHDNINLRVSNSNRSMGDF